MIGRLAAVVRRPSIPPSLRFVPFRGRVAVASGLVSRRQLAGPAWRRLLPDVYAHVDAPLDRLAWCQAAALLLPPGGAISGRSAALLFGADVLPLDAPVEVTVPRPAAMRQHARLVVRRAVLPPYEVTRRNGLPATTPVRTAFDLARQPDLVEAVVGVDALLYRRVVKLEQLATYSAGRRGWRNVRQVPRVLSLAATEVESPMETRTRLVIVLAGLPAPVVQFDVLDRAGRFVARVDLAYPHIRLAIEYDGDHHRERATFRRDVARLNALRLAGWTVLRFTADDILRHPSRVVAQVRAALMASTSTTATE